MIHKIGRPLIALIAFSPLLVSANEIQVSMRLSPSVIGHADSTQLKIEVISPVSQVVFDPTFDAPDFTIVGTQPSRAGAPVESFPGSGVIRSKATSYTYTLSPNRTGILEIKNIKVRIGNLERPLPNQRIQVVADNQSDSPPPPHKAPAPNQQTDRDDTSNPASPYFQPGSSLSKLGGNNRGAGTGELPKTFNSDFTVFAQVDKLQAYVGEPIQVQYWLFDFGSLRRIEVQKWPTFNGFWKEDLELASRIDLIPTLLEGEPGRRAFLGRFAVYGIKPGTFNLDKLVVKGQYASQRMAQNFFQAFDLQTGIHGSQDLSIKILPLPKEGQPANFTGAVGQFNLKFTADKITLPQNTPLNLSVTLAGKGNFQAIDKIPFSIPQDFESYDTTVAPPAVLGQRRNLETEKTFQTLVIPRKAGKFTIGPVQWNYFDPESGKYLSAEAPALEVEVTPNDLPTTGSNLYGVNSNIDASTGGNGLAYRTIPAIEAISRDQWWKVSVWILLLLNFGFLVALILRSRTLKQWLQSRADPYGEALAAIGRAQSASPQKQVEMVEEALEAIFSCAFRQSAKGMTSVERQEKWRELSLPEAAWRKLDEMAQKVEASRYSSLKGKQTNAKEWTEELREIVKKIR
jgi:hypothetical protein